MIPAEAVEAAKKVAYERYGSKPDTAYLRTILEAAAPYMLAAAWEAGERAGFEESFRDNDPRPTRNPYRPTP